MKKVMLVVLMVSFLSIGSCGGSSSGGGGSLATSRVELIYRLVNSGTPVELALEAMLGELAVDQCLGGSTAMDGLNGACEGGGTWALSGTLNCTYSEVGTVATAVITSTTGGQLALVDCISTQVIADADVTAQAEATTYNTILNGTLSPFSIQNTTIVGDLADPDNPTLNINGSATETYTNMQLTGTVTATTSFTSEITFVNFTGGDTGISCAGNTVAATESSESGTCTIQNNCYDCL